LILAQSTGPGGDGGAPGGNGGAGTGGGGHGGGPVDVYRGVPADSGACGVGLQLTDPNAYSSAEEGLTAISNETQRYIERCGCATQACIADALDTYASALKKVAPRLPRALRKLPQVVASAAHQARVAPTLRAAVKVLRAAIAVIHKTVELARPTDPDEASVATRGGELVSHTLDTAATALERAETL
jgi:hypothetical protein